MDKVIEQLMDGFVDHAFDIAAGKAKKHVDDSKIAPAALCIPSDGTQNHIIFLPWNDETKIPLIEELGRTCFEKKLLKMALLHDAAMKTYEHLPDATEVPLTYPPEMRMECLILIYVDFMDPKENTVKVYPYKIVDGAIVRDKVIDFKKDAMGMGGNVFGALCMGFTKYAMTDEIVRSEITPDKLNRELGDDILKKVLVKYPGAFLGHSPAYGNKNAI